MGATSVTIKTTKVLSPKSSLFSILFLYYMLPGVAVRFLVNKTRLSIRIVAIRLKGANWIIVITAGAILAAPISAIGLVVS